MNKSELDRRKLEKWQLDKNSKRTVEDLPATGAILAPGQIEHSVDEPAENLPGSQSKQPLTGYRRVRLRGKNCRLIE